LKRWEVLVLIETWLKKKDWDRIRSRLPKGFRWGVQWAVRERKRGRARGGMIMGIREDMAEGEIRIEVGIEGVVMSEIRIGIEKWKIIRVYVSDGIEKMTEKLERWTEKGEGDSIVVIGGDFNARVGGGRWL